MTRQRRVVIIDLEKDRVTIGLERSEVMFLMWIVGVAEVIKDLNRVENAGDRFRTEGCNASCDDSSARAEVLP